MHEHKCLARHFSLFGRAFDLAPQRITHANLQHDTSAVHRGLYPWAVRPVWMPVLTIGSSPLASVKPLSSVASSCCLLSLLLF
jgi:hypothetical protein